MSSQDKPLVTFAVFAYNQEQFIREAIEGVFSQTYEPLEIILSDDCSSDRTFEIMQEMAANYRGKHQVRARRNPHNTGTLDHLLIVAKEAKGQLLVVAAGDDVSLPHRTETLVNHWIKNPCHALCSGYNEIDYEGNLISQNNQIKYLDGLEICYRKCIRPRRFEFNKIRHVTGGSAAYDLKVFQNVPLSNQYILIEDAFASHIINLKGERIEWIQAPLVNYRINCLSVSNFARIARNRKYISYREIEIAEKKAMIFNQSTVNFCNYFFALIKEHNYPDTEQFIENMKPIIYSAELHSKYLNLSLFQKIQQIFKTSSTNDIKFCVSRLFGNYSLYLLRNLFCLVLGVSIQR
ncbi:glycosyltransferase family 2 protein [Thermosynechococcus sp. JY1334]|uniref:glycosyltransferase family 2 protein n=1 Tax=unclassified Thermosynechococcus TaxID=2622553 RepID=UPI00267154C9|nr:MULTISPECIES: glycosyltransferase family 2 protein [unclassified Thermosynechococcus]MDR7899033.1 glycosyltransferase family 2 protein [Thermosynechococcus sp. JY1332]MDR7906438.1 glycosyltransferase family 2 protein [Thermosynechococcus sp. JY1334]WKT86156.1 glycosyltransferase family 2 protein [Thermosynechococcus sp. JY1339]WNC55102.1 glycosyltransferase family 2 protein [Thermosynechococcus sp. JY1331]